MKDWSNLYATRSALPFAIPDRTWLAISVGPIRESAFQPRKIRSAIFIAGVMSGTLPVRTIFRWETLEFRKLRISVWYASHCAWVKPAPFEMPVLCLPILDQIVGMRFRIDAGSWVDSVANVDCIFAPTLPPIGIPILPPEINGQVATGRNVSRTGHLIGKEFARRSSAIPSEQPWRIRSPASFQCFCGQPTPTFSGAFSARKDRFDFSTSNASGSSWTISV